MVGAGLAREEEGRRSGASARPAHALRCGGRDEGPKGEELKVVGGWGGREYRRRRTGAGCEKEGTVALQAGGARAARSRMVK